MTDPISLCPVCGTKLRPFWTGTQQQSFCPKCEERETVIDAEVVSADEWQRIEAGKARVKAEGDLTKIANGIRMNQAIGVIVHCELARIDDLGKQIYPPEAKKKDPGEDVIRNAQELLLAKLDAVTKKG